MDKVETVLAHYRPKTNELYERLFTPKQAHTDYVKAERIGAHDEATQAQIVHNILQLITDTENLLGLGVNAVTPELSPVPGRRPRSSTGGRPILPSFSVW